MYKKENFINASGGCIRDIGNEALQTMYMLTKEPKIDSKKLSDEDRMYFINFKPSDITFEKLVEWFGDTVDVSDGSKNKTRSKSKYSPTDRMSIDPTEYKLCSERVDTTLGRLIFNKLLIELLGFNVFIGYQNKEFKASDFSKFESIVIAALTEDKISTKQMIRYIDTRNWLGLSLHGVITTSFSPAVINMPKELKAYKEKLFNDNKDKIEKGDALAVSKIEKQLISKATDLLKDDYGFNLYQSGARGSVGNHLKNMYLTRGAIYNNSTGKYDIVKNSLSDGLDVKDFPAHSNEITAGSYARGVGTQVGGYMTKELIAALQMERLGPKDSDCGTTVGLKITLSESNYADFKYRYIKTNSKPVMLTDENKAKYINKEVEIFSPMFCRGVGSSHVICNKCAGDFYYLLGKENIGLLSAKVSSKITKLSLASFHDSTVKIKKINTDNMLL